MKLRILGDSLRLRLSQSEVKQFGETGRFVQAIRFGGASLTYALEHGEGVSSLGASMDGSTITVRMPSSMARTWVETDQVTLKAEQSLGDDGALSLLIEKDFKCAIPRPGEENYDGFEHPTGAC